jgi:hypothetical protein
LSCGQAEQAFRLYQYKCRGDAWKPNQTIHSCALSFPANEDSFVDSIRRQSGGEHVQAQNATMLSVMAALNPNDLSVDVHASSFLPPRVSSTYLLLILCPGLSSHHLELPCYGGCHCTVAGISWWRCDKDRRQQERLVSSAEWLGVGIRAPFLQNSIDMMNVRW